MIAFILVPIFASDHHLGKADKSSFSQQTLMELFIESFDPKENIFGSPENESDISEWQDVDAICDDQVTSISWDFFDFVGTLPLHRLPSTVEEFISLEIS